MEAANLMLIFYIFIFISLGYLVGKYLSSFFLKLQNLIRKTVNVRSHRMHHDLGGIIFVLIGVSLKNLQLKTALISFGIGLFLHHIHKHGLKFISNDRI